MLSTNIAAAIRLQNTNIIFLLTLLLIVEMILDGHAHRMK